MKKIFIAYFAILGLTACKSPSTAEINSNQVLTKIHSYSFQLSGIIVTQMSRVNNTSDSSISNYFFSYTTPDSIATVDPKVGDTKIPISYVPTQNGDTLSLSSYADTRGYSSDTHTYTKTTLNVVPDIINGRLKYLSFAYSQEGPVDPRYDTWGDHGFVIYDVPCHFEHDTLIAEARGHKLNLKTGQ